MSQLITQTISLSQYTSTINYTKCFPKSITKLITQKLKKVVVVSKEKNLRKSGSVPKLGAIFPETLSLWKTLQPWQD